MTDGVGNVSGGRNDDEKMSNSEIVVRVNGWDLVSESGKVEEARIVDTDLAKRLEISEPRMIRRIIKRLIDDGYLPGIHMRSRNERIEMKTGVYRESVVEEYLLNEEEVLLVTTQSKTPKAMLVTKEMISVFVALRRGLLSGQSPDQLVEVLSRKLEEKLEQVTTQLTVYRADAKNSETNLAMRLDHIERHKHGLMGEEDARELRRQMTEVAHQRIALGEAGKFLSIYRSVDDAIRREVGYPNEKGAKWELCDVERGTRAFSRIGMMAHTVSTALNKKRAAEKKAAAEKQIEMFCKAVQEV